MTVSTEGSGPGSPGAVMAVSSRDSFGTVGGGAMEMTLVRRAGEMLEAGSPGPELIEHQHTVSPSGIGTPSGMICSGSQVTALLTVGADSLTDLELAEDILAGGRTGTFLLGRQGIHVREGGFRDPLSFSRTGEGGWSFTGLLGLVDTVYIVGGGHVGRALAELLVRLPFRPVIIDERPAPSLDFPCEWLRSLYADSHTLIPKGEHSWVVVMTPSHGADGEVLRNLAEMDLRYVGLMASRAKRQALFAELREAGTSGEWLEGVRSPIGLPIGGRSPWEIAVSVAAQLISEKCKK